MKTKTIYCILILILSFNYKGYSKINTDTTKMIVRICRDDHPLHPILKGADYINVVCVYKYFNGTIETYDVKSFQLVYIKSTNDTIRITGKNNFLNSEMKMIISTLNETSIKNLFLDSIEIIDKDNKTTILNGLRPFYINKQE